MQENLRKMKTLIIGVVLCILMLTIIGCTRICNDDPESDFKETPISTGIDGFDSLSIPESAIYKISVHPDEVIDLTREGKNSILRKHNMNFQLFRYLNGDYKVKPEELRMVDGPFVIKYSVVTGKAFIVLNSFRCAQLNCSEILGKGSFSAIPRGKYILSHDPYNISNFNSLFNDYPLVFVREFNGSKKKIAVIPENHPDNLLFKKAMEANAIVTLEINSYKLLSGLLVEKMSYFEIE